LTATVSTIDEKRVYGDRRGARTAYVASPIGVAAVSISGETVGEFGLIHRGDARDLAVDAEALVVATDEDVHVVTGETVHADGGPDDLAAVGSATDFGAATAVGVDDHGRALAAKGDGRLARFEDGWEVLGTVPAAVRAFGRDTVAAADGIRSLSNLERPTLDDVRDVADPGPVVATGTGVYRHEDSVDGVAGTDDSAWRRERNGTTDRVAVSGDRLVAVANGALLSKDDRNWDRPVDAQDVRDVATAGDRFYAVTDTGTVYVEGEDEWRSRSVGLQDVRRLAVA
jgi:hypothetical protein